MRTILAVSLLILSSAIPALSQSGCIHIQSIEPPVPTGTGQPTVTGAVRLCTPAATGTPCSPLYNPIYFDPALSQSQSNPTTTDTYGNFNFCAAPGNYLAQVTTNSGSINSYYTQAANANASVTSVGLILPGTIFSVSGSPVTGSGNLTASLITQSGDTVFGNCTSSTATPGFCAITAAMLPTTVNSLIIDGTLATTSSGNTSIGGTLGVTGATTLSSSLGVTGAATLSGGGTLTGTFTGNPIFSGNPSFTGTPGFTAISASSTITGSQLISTTSVGAPLAVSSSTVVGSLNSSLLLGNTWASPGAIGSTTPNSGVFTTLQANTSFVLNGSGTLTSVIGTDTKLMSAGTVSGSAGSLLCLDSNSGITTSGCSTPAVSVIRYGSASGCATGSSAGSTCTSSVTWNSSFADTGYYPNCTGYGINGSPYIVGFTALATGSVTVETSNGQGSQAQISSYGTIYCVGVHP